MQPSEATIQAMEPLAASQGSAEAGAPVTPQTAGGDCACGGSAAPAPGGTGTIPFSFIYAIGRVGFRFPNESVEKEFAQATGRAETAGLTDRQALHSLLSKRENRYLARQLCWVLSIEGMETYILQPRDPGDFELLIQALRPTPRATDVDAVIGLRGPLASPQVCNGLIVPIVVFDQLYSFDMGSLVKSIPRPKEVPETQEAQFRAAAEELFLHISQIADNAGATDEDRARNYLVVRYPAIYSKTAEMHQRNFALSAVEARPSTIFGARRVVDVVFSFTNRSNDVIEKFLVRVDITQEFPFLVTKMSAYFDR
jgi:hypothetical protein